ncbi:hypothetical protein BDK51DRAFT_31468 [Blyttiomyces helicus]|uniref:CSC1/OSCA1-like 7TM region domain-containing protein n=1 Tax=Blyttiomyces helicus TaxID=388810 RepID=A0A4P9WTG6_9FUNG|nr:hypothetical protein BDK51DRAFT_31468 [Blyttiomyces helicus]|eukprot:RKO94356.1 hypothetical protein BDK51DRAFT_31468 [Blyttiomyces helicus]
MFVTGMTLLLLSGWMRCIRAVPLGVTRCRLMISWWQVRGVITVIKLLVNLLHLVKQGCLGFPQLLQSLFFPPLLPVWVGLSLPPPLPSQFYRLRALYTVSSAADALQITMSQNSMILIVLGVPLLNLFIPILFSLLHHIDLVGIMRDGRQAWFESHKTFERIEPPRERDLRSLFCLGWLLALGDSSRTEGVKNKVQKGEVPPRLLSPLEIFSYNECLDECSLTPSESAEPRPLLFSGQSKTRGLS